MCSDGVIIVETIKNPVNTCFNLANCNQSVISRFAGVHAQTVVQPYDKGIGRPAEVFPPAHTHGGPIWIRGFGSEDEFYRATSPVQSRRNNNNDPPPCFISRLERGYDPHENRTFDSTAEHHFYQFGGHGHSPDRGGNDWSDGRFPQTRNNGRILTCGKNVLRLFFISTTIIFIDFICLSITYCWTARMFLKTILIPNDGECPLNMNRVDKIILELIYDK